VNGIAPQGRYDSLVLSDDTSCVAKPAIPVGPRKNAAERDESRIQVTAVVGVVLIVLK